MAPITWRNVSAGNNMAAVAATQNAADSFNKAISGLKNVGSIYEDRETEARNKAIAGNTADIIAQMKGIGSPEEYQQALQSGSLSNEIFQNQYGEGNYDRSAVDAFRDSRLGNLRNQATETSAFEDQIRKRAERPLRDKVSTLIAANDFAGARKLIDSNPAMNFSQELNLLEKDVRSEQTHLLQEGARKRAEAIDANLRSALSNTAKGTYQEQEKAFLSGLPTDATVTERNNAADEFRKAFDRINRGSIKGEQLKVAEAQVRGQELETQVQFSKENYEKVQRENPISPATTEALANNDRQGLNDYINKIHDGGWLTGLFENKAGSGLRALVADDLGKTVNGNKVEPYHIMTALSNLQDGGAVDPEDYKAELERIMKDDTLKERVKRIEAAKLQYDKDRLGLAKSTLDAQRSLYGQ